MEKEKLFNLLIPKDRSLVKIAQHLIKNPESIPFLFEGVKNENARIRYGCFNTLVLISEKYPALLYPHFDLFVNFLNSDRKVIKLGGIKIISNLSKVDVNNKFDNIFDKFYAFINDSEMTTAANVCKGSLMIAKAKPHLSENIVQRLLTVAQTKYKSEECKNILIGLAIVSFDKMYKEIENKHSVIKFVENNKNNRWIPTRKKAEKFLTKYGKPIV